MNYDIFNQLDQSIKNIASKGDLLLFEGSISKKDWDSLIEDCLICSCFYTGYYNKRPDILINFIENEKVKDKLSNKERKQLGSYFTPSYIAEYIVKKTLNDKINKIIKSRIKDKVKKICTIKICDPAMGTGIFLVCVHNYLMNELICLDQDKYTIEEMAVMSAKTIYGVDINYKAVDLAKTIIHLNIGKWASINKIDEYVKTVELNSY